MVIKSVDDKNERKSYGKANCSACEMTVSWMQNQIRHNQTPYEILSNAKQVGST